MPLKTIFLLFYFVPLALFGQLDTLRIKGTVSDNMRYPMPFANVVVFDIDQLIGGTVADIDGFFSLSIPVTKDSFRLKFSSVAQPEVWLTVYKSKEVQELNVSLKYQFSKERISKIQQDAEKQIQKGIAHLLTTDYKHAPNFIARSYGFRYKYITIPRRYDSYCLMNFEFDEETEAALLYVEIFNEYTLSYLEKRNGKNWETRLKNDEEENNKRIEERDAYWKGKVK